MEKVTKIDKFCLYLKRIKFDSKEERGTSSDV